MYTLLVVFSDKIVVHYTNILQRIKLFKSPLKNIRIHEHCVQRLSEKMMNCEQGIKKLVSGWSVYGSCCAFWGNDVVFICLLR